MRVNAAPLVMLVFTSIIMPRASFIGHLAGIVVGFPLAWGVLDPVANPPAMAAACVLASLAHRGLLLPVPPSDGWGGSASPGHPSNLRALTEAAEALACCLRPPHGCLTSGEEGDDDGEQQQLHLLSSTAETRRRDAGWTARSRLAASLAAGASTLAALSLWPIVAPASLLPHALGLVLAAFAVAAHPLGRPPNGCGLRAAAPLLRCTPRAHPLMLVAATGGVAAANSAHSLLSAAALEARRPLAAAAVAEVAIGRGAALPGDSLVGAAVGAFAVLSLIQLAVGASAYALLQTLPGGAAALGTWGLLHPPLEVPSDVFVGTGRTLSASQGKTEGQAPPGSLAPSRSGRGGKGERWCGGMAVGSGLASGRGEGRESAAGSPPLSNPWA